MNKAKIGLYVALIFLAGVVAGFFGGPSIRAAWKTTQPPPPPRNREDFANHIFNRMKERLELTPEQIEKIEPVFRKGIEDVRAIQDRSVKEVDAAVKRNHEEIEKMITPAQREKMQAWDREREKAMKERRNHRRGPGGAPLDGPGGPGGPGGVGGPGGMAPGKEMPPSEPPSNPAKPAQQAQQAQQ